MRSFIVLFLTALMPLTAGATGRLFTYFEGRLVKKKAMVWEVRTVEGTYQIDMHRPPNWLRQGDRGEVSFWVSVDQVRRFRPTVINTPARQFFRPRAVAHQPPRTARRPRG